MIDIFIIGSKGIPAKYGGFETFVENLTARKMSEEIRYHVSCMSKNEAEFEHNGARCFNVKVKNIGSAKAVLYDLLSLNQCIKYIKANQLQNTIVYILACRIGPFLGYYQKVLKKIGIKVYVNPDGHEWKRSKWNRWIKAYWKFSEKLMVKYSDLLICDSRAIETYIKSEYHKYNPVTVYIAYGADVTPSILKDGDKRIADWYHQHTIKTGEYYLVVGRFVPENNFEVFIREFIKSGTNKELVIISNVENNPYYNTLLANTHFDQDSRIKFVGTVYDEALLKKIRENAFAYIHGHEVGGTNPSLLEALASTKLNILLSVSFNLEVGRGGALYFTKENGSLVKIIEEVEDYSNETIFMFAEKAKNIIRSVYSWDEIVSTYEDLFSDKYRVKGVKVNEWKVEIDKMFTKK
jgi:rhamnosyltransferase